MLLSKGTHDPNAPQVVRKLRDLHPNEPALPALAANAWDRESRLSFEDEEDVVAERCAALKKAVFDFPAMSAPGPSGLRPEHLKAMLGDYAMGSSMRLLHALDRFTCMAPGDAGLSPLVTP